MVCSRVQTPRTVSTGSCPSLWPSPLCWKSPVRSSISFFSTHRSFSWAARSRGESRILGETETREAGAVGGCSACRVAWGTVSPALAGLAGSGPSPSKARHSAAPSPGTLMRHSLEGSGKDSGVQLGDPREPSGLLEAEVMPSESGKWTKVGTATSVSMGPHSLGRTREPGLRHPECMKRRPHS